MSREVPRVIFGTHKTKNLAAVILKTEKQTLYAHFPVEELREALKTIEDDLAARIK